MAQLVSWGGQNNLKLGQLRLAQQYADAGMFARAKAAFEAAGGVWGNEVHKLFKTEAAETTRYGGDIVFNWGDYGVRTQEQLNQIITWSKAGQFGKVANLINNLGGAKKWDADGNRLHKKLAAEYVGAQEADQDKTKPGWQGTPTTEFKRDEPDTTPALYKPTVDTQGADNTWREQFKTAITPGQEGSWKSGQARNDAQKWRDLHMNATMNKYGLSRNESGQIKRASSADITDTDWDSFIKKRNEIDTRFRKMIDKPLGS